MTLEQGLGLASDSYWEKFKGKVSQFLRLTCIRRKNSLTYYLQGLALQSKWFSAWCVSMGSL